jgi:hypothetical protein
MVHLVGRPPTPATRPQPGRRQVPYDPSYTGIGGLRHMEYMGHSRTVADDIILYPLMGKKGVNSHS